MKISFRDKWIVKFAAVEAAHCENEKCHNVMGAIINILKNPMDVAELVVISRNAMVDEDIPEYVREIIKEFLKELPSAV